MYAEVQDFFHQYGGQDNSTTTNNKHNNPGEINNHGGEITVRGGYPTPPLSSSSFSPNNSFSSTSAVRNLTPYFEEEDSELILPSLNTEFIHGFPGRGFDLNFKTKHPTRQFFFQKHIFSPF